MKFISPFKTKLIYVFSINDKKYEDCLKIGETTFDCQNIFELNPNSTILNQSAHKRIKQYTQTVGIDYDLLYTEVAIYTKNSNIKAFSDHEVHKVLKRSGIKKKEFGKKNKSNEWFITDLETVKKAIKAVKEEKDSLNHTQITTNQNPILFRPEQKEAIKKTKKQFKKSNEMLWYAKMRFGKTLTALQVIKEMSFVRTLILTHRPVVDKGWFGDFSKIFHESSNYSYGSKNQGDRFQILESKCKKEEVKYIYFASIQDLRGSEKVGGNFNKNDDIFSTSWDFIIVDEAHEGTQTELGKNVLKELAKESTKILHLSGTPFNLLDDYKEDEIFTWDYVMEQKAKNDWDNTHFGDPNPYSSLPKLNIYTYDLGKLLHKFIDEDVAFNFREFFRVDKNGNFIHKKDVLSFLNLICEKNDKSKYPYSTDEYRDNFRHSLWMVPGVKEAKALSKLLKEHNIFSQFEIINVAGDGDEEEASEDALKKVEDTITNKPHETYTITLSCGRLTTGVSIEAWTAVFMLYGSYSTLASSYMQTIFRVQTPAIINGKIKEECFVFDFAPDRTLKIIAQTANISAKAGKTQESDRTVMSEFLNFCPIISLDGGKMKEYDTNSMLEQLKKVYIERVVRNGFEDGSLYNNDELMKLGEIDLEEFNSLKKIIGSTKAIPKNEDIDINNQGFSDEEYAELEKIEKKNKKDLTKENEQLLEKKNEKKKNRDTAISILRGISIRMPLIIYGADISDEENELTIDNFSKLVDDKSWEEFMPKGVDKKTFDKFKKYYEPDIFRASGKRIRAMARIADNLSIEERINRITNIFNTFKNPDKETVLTPWRVVNMHIGDTLGGYVFLDDKREKIIDKPRFVSHGDVTKNVFSANSKILEINSKSGLYPLFMTYSIYRNLIQEIYPNKTLDELTIDEQYQVWDRVIKQNIFIICKTPMAKSITKRTLVGFRKVNVNARYFEDLVYQIINGSEKFIKTIKEGKDYWKIKENNNMKFNAIIGNPPYQQMDGGAKASAKPIYNQFVNVAKKINPNYISMIMPTRWYAGGKGLDKFRDEMLNDKNIAVLHDYLNPDEIFPKINIRGGICYFLWDKNYNNSIKQTQVITHKNKDSSSMTFRNLKTKDVDIFIRQSLAVEILNKIKLDLEFKSFKDNVSARKPFGFESNISSLKPFGFRGYFIKDKKFRSSKKGLKEPITCYGKGKQIGYLDKKEITKNIDWIDKYKVYTSRANNIGTELNDDNLNTFVGLPNTICTESYIVVGIDLDLDELSATNLCKYFTTKFARFVHGIGKASHDATSKTYKFVPLQDFTSISDIDWSISIQDIDKQLYKKYNLTQEEIEFIEDTIKPMK